MPRSRGWLVVNTSLLLSANLIATPIWGNSTVGLGTVLSADRAHVGAAAASAGATVFAGDTLNTEKGGALQLRSGAARLLLSGDTHLKWGGVEASANATLTGGTVAFSTARADAFALHAGTAIFRPKGDEPTVGNVTLLNPKELVVRCSRGSLLIEVEDDIRVIPEGSAYRVVLDPEAAARAASAPQPDPSAWGQHQPIKSGKSKFIWYAIIFTGVVTGIALHYALESPDRP
jgi:hypothetical protein